MKGFTTPRPDDPGVGRRAPAEQAPAPLSASDSGRSTRGRELTRGRLLAGNTALSVAGELVPMAAAVVAIPLLLRGLGTDRFGILSLAWVVIGYFSLFDLGVGNALTKLVASRLGEGREAEIPRLVSAALVLMGLLGLAGGVTLAGSAPWLIERWLKVPTGLQREALACFRLLAVAVPVVVATSAFRGLLQAEQRVGLLLSIRIPVGVLSYAAPIAVLAFTSSLVPVVAALVVVRCVSLGLYVAACRRVVPALRRGGTVSWAETTALVRFGSWMTVTNVLSPLLMMLDRFVIGSIVSVGAVAYYATPLDIVNYVGVIPGAMVTVLFPAFATSFAQDRERTAALYAAGVKLNLALMFPVALVLVAFAREGLTIWLGGDFAREGAPVIRWIAFGLLLSAVSRVAFWLVQGVGRPDLPAKFHVLEIVVYVPLLWWSTWSFGIGGAAAAWTGRIALDAGLLLFASGELVPLPRGVRTRLMTTVLSALAALGLIQLVESVPLRLAAVSVVVAGFACLCWRGLLSSEERAWVRNAVSDVRVTAGLG